MTDVCLVASQSDYKHKMEGGLTGIEINGADRGREGEGYANLLTDNK
jgi:hypothetical protein